MNEVDTKKFSDPDWLLENQFEALSEISRFLSEEEKEIIGREALIRVLEHRKILGNYQPVVEALIQRAGLYPYQQTNHMALSTRDLLNLESHAVDGLDDIILHAVQGQVYRALIDGKNIILGAPTSFGKSLLIDAMIASGKFKKVVVIVPTIALIDETRRRLSKRFSGDYKIITHPSQSPEEECIYVLTQERFVEFRETPAADFFVVDEFYKLSPNRKDERTFILNQAFYKLRKSGGQFFLIGPNVKKINVDEDTLDCKFFQTNFSTVAAEVDLISGGNKTEHAINICRSADDPTLIFCKSPKSTQVLAKALLSKGIKAPSESATKLADWIRENYHQEWLLADLLDAGIALHYSALPRSIAYHILRRFNDRSIKFLLCTSTIIEGVNTSAKRIIIYDNKIAQKTFDLFTFNNIKGRAGRMFEHYVGHIHVLNAEPQQELPFIDIPSITQPPEAPESLLIQIDSNDLLESSQERLQYLHNQDILPVEIIRSNAGIEPEHQLNLATDITKNIDEYYPLLSWTGYPNWDELSKVCHLIFEYFMGSRRQDGIVSARQLCKKISMLRPKNMQPQEGIISRLVTAESSFMQTASPSEALESVLKFIRQWGEFHFPRYLFAINQIQKSIFSRARRKPGDYSVFSADVKRLFMPLSATILEEYGLPFQVTLKIEKQYPLGDGVDEILANLKAVNISKLNLTPIEYEMVRDTIENL